jgi:hypothetical protein
MRAKDARRALPGSRVGGGRGRSARDVIRPLTPLSIGQKLLLRGVAVAGVDHLLYRGSRAQAPRSLPTSPRHGESWGNRIPPFAEYGAPSSPARSPPSSPTKSPPAHAPPHRRAKVAPDAPSDGRCACGRCRSPPVPAPSRRGCDCPLGGSGRRRGWGESCGAYS